MTKNWFQSRTIWFNVVGLVVVILEYLGTINLPVNPEILTIALTVCNAILRFRTDEGIRL